MCQQIIQTPQTMKTETVQNLTIAAIGALTVALLAFCSINGIGY